MIVRQCMYPDMKKIGFKRNKNNSSGCCSQLLEVCEEDTDQAGMDEFKIFGCEDQSNSIEELIVTPQVEGRRTQIKIYTEAHSTCLRHSAFFATRGESTSTPFTKFPRLHRSHH